MDLLRFDPTGDPDRFGNGPLPSNREQPWTATDTEELFDQHWNNTATRERLIACGWTKTNIRYRSNDRGFRTPVDFKDLIPGAGNFYLGCSITFGIGLNVEDTWAWKLNQRIGGDFINLAWPGTGIETQYRMLKSWAARLRPRRAYTIGAFSGRRELLGDAGKIRRFGPWTTGEDLGLYRSLSEDDEIRISFIRAIDAMRAVCTDNGIELYAPMANSMETLRRSEKRNFLARDLLHWGPSWHGRIAGFSDDWWERLA